MLKSKLSLNWTRPFKILRVGPSTSTPDGKHIGDTLLFSNLPSGLREMNAKHRVSVVRHKPCVNPHDADDRCRYLPAGFSECLLANMSRRCLIFHATVDDVKPSVEVERLEVDFVEARQFVRGSGGRISVFFMRLEGLD